MMTRREAQAAFGGRAVALAKFLDVTEQTIYRLRMKDKLPVHHALLVAYAFPETFAACVAEFQAEAQDRREATERWISKHPGAKPRQPKLPFNGSG